MKGMKKTLSEKGEACTLITDNSDLTLRLVDNFLKYSGGCFKVLKDSPHFVVTVKLEKKKEVKKRE